MDTAKETTEPEWVTADDMVTKVALLREAARVLRQAAIDATPGPWVAVVCPALDDGATSAYVEQPAARGGHLVADLTDCTDEDHPRQASGDARGTLGGSC